MTHTATSGPIQVVPEAPPGDAQGLTAKSLSPRQMAVRRYLAHKPAMIALVVMIIMILFVLFAPITARSGINEPIYTVASGKGNARYLAPNTDAWFGTDEIGRDLYSRLIYGTR